MLGNIIVFNSAYQNIVNSKKAGKDDDAFFYIGRILFLMFDVKPIEWGSLTRGE